MYHQGGGVKEKKEERSKQPSLSLSLSLLPLANEALPSGAERDPNQPTNHAGERGDEKVFAFGVEEEEEEACRFTGERSVLRSGSLVDLLKILLKLFFVGRQRSYHAQFKVIFLHLRICHENHLSNSKYRNSRKCNLVPALQSFIWV